MDAASGADVPEAAVLHRVVSSFDACPVVVRIVQDGLKLRFAGLWSWWTQFPNPAASHVTLSMTGSPFSKEFLETVERRTLPYPKPVGRRR